tara:strand:+ start:1688 stop:2548 length:861 start_codon:yes stop_codon:yes gene_type:complete
MKKNIIFIILLSICNIVVAGQFVPSNKIINIKYGYKLGDLIIVQDKIISNKKFIVTPELTVKKNKNFILVNQTYEIKNEVDKFIFLNKIIYQNYIKEGSGIYELPLHSYKIKKEDILIPQQKIWFTRIAKSKLNNVLLNSTDQIKPKLIKKDWIYWPTLLCISLFILLIILYRNLDITFIKRMNGPFSKAYRKIRILHIDNNKENYVKSILILTDAFNKTFEMNINSLNFEALINNNKYQEMKDEINIFVNVSSVEIYSSKTYFTKIRFDEIYNFTKILKVIERKF